MNTECLTIGGIPVNLKVLIRLLSEKSTRNSPENLTLFYKAIPTFDGVYFFGMHFCRDSDATLRP